MNAILLSAISTTCLIASLFFFHFWQKTHDRFFLFFAASFIISGADRILLAFVNPSDEQEPIFYILRLVAFFIIICAIVDKNRIMK